MIKTQRPPKVPQIFPPTQATFVQTLHPNEMPLSLQVLYAGCPKSSGKSENCKEKLMAILNFLSERESGNGRRIDSPKILQAKEMLKTDNQKLILDATKNAIQHILAKNYQYQDFSSNILRQTLGQAVTVEPPMRQIVRARQVPTKYYLNIQKQNYANPLTQSQPKIVQNLPSFKNSLPPWYVDPSVVQNESINNPVIPVTSISGQINDNDDVLVFYKPKVVTYTQLYGNGLRKFSKRILVPYYVSKIN